nr:MAG TPA: hypothetical protein [Caudoviricetes sp.]
MEQRKETDRTITTLKIRNNIIRKLPDSLFLKESAQKDIPQRLHAPPFPVFVIYFSFTALQVF